LQLALAVHIEVLLGPPLVPHAGVLEPRERLLDEIRVGPLNLEGYLGVSNQQRRRP